LAVDALSRVLQDSLEAGSIQGVKLVPTGKQVLHSIYANDVSIVARADMSCIQRIMHLLEVFGKASGLHVNWQKTNAAFISPRPTPAPLLALGWKWETDLTATKLLGYPVAPHFSEEQSTKLVRDKLEEQLQKSRQNPVSLAAQITLANHFILSSLWYILTLWPG
jgi:hypothetical protein